MNPNVSAALEKAVEDKLSELEVPVPGSDGVVWEYNLRDMTQVRVSSSSKYRTMRYIRRIQILLGRVRGDGTGEGDENNTAKAITAAPEPVSADAAAPAAASEDTAKANRPPSTTEACDSESKRARTDIAMDGGGSA